MKWKRSGRRSYRNDSDLWNAFVFGNPDCFLWAWYVAWKGGSKSGVNHSFRSAKKAAQDWIENGSIAWMTAHQGTYAREFELMNRLNEGNPNYTPYQVADEKKS